MSIIVTIQIIICVHILKIESQIYDGLEKPCNIEMLDDVCVLSLAGFEVSFYPIDSLKMFYLDYNNCNSYVDKTIFREKPFFKLKFLYPDDLFTVMMLDGTKDYSEEGAYYLHYAACNIVGEDLGFAETSDSLELASYVPPVPIKSYKNHTIIFFIFRQTEEYHLETLNITLLTRENFNPIAWAQQQIGVKLCGPIAALQMQTSY